MDQTVAVVVKLNSGLAKAGLRARRNRDEQDARRRGRPVLFRVEQVEPARGCNGAGGEGGCRVGRKARNRRRKVEGAVHRDRIDNAFAHSEDLRALAREKGLRVKVDPREEVGSYWTFRRPGGAPLLHYWPATGRWWAPATGQRGAGADPFQALDIAAGVAGVR